MKPKSESEVAESCLTLSDPMDCSPPGSSVYGIFQARVLEWGAIAFSKCIRYSLTFIKTLRHILSRGKILSLREGNQHRWNKIDIETEPKDL